MTPTTATRQPTPTPVTMRLRTRGQVPVSGVANGPMNMPTAIVVVAMTPILRRPMRSASGATMIEPTSMPIRAPDMTSPSSAFETPKPLSM